ncbi:hypothetical protein [Natronomonas marina]|jgi:hypothetical protein|uniref:hypothetical protein n=1 Tax=Natronomonas marina TaxID=2961939 RepID=UPI0020C991E4|nr:hypothetical protein [Natronomonas marina]
MAATPAERRQAIVSAIVDARRTDESATFVVDRAGSVVYDDRTLRVELDADERERLEALLEEYGVFKLRQPETRKAETGVVYLSAVTDPKHAADFVEALFRQVYGAEEGYELAVE